jgi:HEAT repeat protein
MQRKRRIWLFALAMVMAVLFGAVAWLMLPPRDPMFRGKPESEWIKGVVYGMQLSDSENKAQAQRWREFGPDGLRILENGLKPAPGRTYRKLYRRYARKLPQFIVRLLPSPPVDKLRGTRMNVLSLLSRMREDARPAWRAVARALEDEDEGVRQIAITFFTSPEDKTAFLNHMPARDKQKLLPLFMRALKEGSNWGLRNNAALALRYYPEKASEVAPALSVALRDTQPYVRLTASESLNDLDANAAKNAEVVKVLGGLVTNADDQVAGRAAFALRACTNDADLAVAALIDALHSTNSNVGCNAVWSLQWAFPSHADAIIPELKKAAERKDNVAGYARSAITHLESTRSR